MDWNGKLAAMSRFSIGEVIPAGSGSAGWSGGECRLRASGCAGPVLGGAVREARVASKISIDLGLRTGVVNLLRSASVAYVNGTAESELAFLARVGDECRALLELAECSVLESSLHRADCHAAFSSRWRPRLAQPASFPVVTWERSGEAALHSLSLIPPLIIMLRNIMRYGIIIAWNSLTGGRRSGVWTARWNMTGHSR